MNNRYNKPLPISIIGIILLGIYIVWWSPKIKKPTVDNSSLNQIIFDNQKQIMNANGITDNDFIKINSKKEIKKIRKKLGKDKYAFITFDGYVLKANKNILGKTWTLRTSFGKYICDSTPYGFVPIAENIWQLWTNPKKINARIYALVPRSGKMYIYKMDKSFNDELSLYNAEEQSIYNVSQINTIESQDLNTDTEKSFIEKLSGDNIIYVFMVALFIPNLFFMYFLKNKILIPRFILLIFDILAILTVLLVLFQFIITLNITLSFILTRIGAFTVVIVCNRTINLYKNTFY
jgi:hypothetical protein